MLSINELLETLQLLQQEEVNYMSINAVNGVDRNSANSVFNIGTYTVTCQENAQKWTYSDSLNGKISRIAYQAFFLLNIAFCVAIAASEQARNMVLATTRAMRWPEGVISFMRFGAVFWGGYIIQIAMDQFFPDTYINSSTGLLQAMKKEIIVDSAWTERKEDLIKIGTSIDSNLDQTCDFLGFVLGLDFVPSETKLNSIDFLLQQGNFPDDGIVGLAIRDKLKAALEVALKLDIPEGKKREIANFILKHNLTIQGDFVCAMGAVGGMG